MTLIKGMKIISPYKEKSDTKKYSLKSKIKAEFCLVRKYEIKTRQII